MATVNQVSGAMAQHMYGAGNGRGMGRIMRELSPDQRQQVRDLLQSLPQEERKAVKDQLLQLNLEGVTQEDLFNQVMSILQQAASTTSTTTTSSDTTSSVSVYA